MYKNFPWKGVYKNYLDAILGIKRLEQIKQNMDMDDYEYDKFYFMQQCDIVCGLFRDSVKELAFDNLLDKTGREIDKETNMLTASVLVDSLENISEMIVSLCQVPESDCVMEHRYNGLR